ncbi:NRT2.5 [Symbiodinium sp. CCMP2592]|nr:NRT2.5 [Symbiodinium sp. CCMP2592]
MGRMGLFRDAPQGVAAVASSILACIVLGTLLERFGPGNVHSGLPTFGAIWVVTAAASCAPWNYALTRFFICRTGATFVTLDANQFTCSLMVVLNVIGTATAEATEWGNLGHGVTQILSILVLSEITIHSGMAADTAWRVSLIVPAVFCLVTATGLKLLRRNTSTAARLDVSVTGKITKSLLWDSFEVLKDFRVVVRIMLYSTSIRTELAMNNQLTTRFRTYFLMDAADVSVLAGSFGLLNLVPYLCVHYVDVLCPGHLG